MSGGVPAVGRRPERLAPQPVTENAMLELIVLTVLFIFLSGLVAMVDAAILSVSAAETEEMVTRRLWGALKVRKVTGRLTRSLVVIVIVTNSINVLGPILIGQSAVATYGPAAIGWVTLALTLGTIVFSEIIPKSLGAHYAPRISRFAALPILFLMDLLYPLVLLLEAFSRLFKKGQRPVGTEAQIQALTTLGRRAGYIEADEGLLVQNAFILNDRTARDIMTLRQDTVALSARLTLTDASRQVFESEFSRYPVFGDSIDDYKGVVLARDILKAVVNGRGGEIVLSATREGLTVSADRRCDSLLLLFRLRRLHLAVVEDDGRTVGIVTLEDVLEELVGEISDEKDTAF